MLVIIAEIMKLEEKAHWFHKSWVNHENANGKRSINLVHFVMVTSLTGIQHFTNKVLQFNMSNPCNKIILTKSKEDCVFIIYNIAFVYS